MEKRKFSIIGCEHAHIGMFIDEMLKLGHVCAGIHEPENTKLAQSMSEQFKVPIVNDRESLLQDDIDIVGCASINVEKIDIIELCEQHGKHIMIDKPAVTNEKDFARLQEVVGRGRIEIGMLLTERFHSAVYTLKTKMDQGVLGRIVNIGIRKPHRLNPLQRPQWFFSHEQSGGIIIDLFIHDYDLLRWFTGAGVVASSGHMVKNILPEHPSFYDVAGVQVMMENNVTAQLYADWHTPEMSWTWGDGRIFVAGTKGFAELRLAGDPHVEKQPLLLTVTNEEGPTQVPLEHPSMTITADFLQRIDGKSSMITHNDILVATKDTLDADSAVQLIHSVNDGGNYR